MLADWRATRSPGTEIVMKSSLKSLASDNRAVTALEYGIIAGVLGLVLIAIFQNFGTTLSSLFTTIGSSI
jgi:pilus assembly protein Flp/PilA